MGFLAPKTQTPTIVNVPTPSSAIPEQQVQGTKPNKQNMTPSFLGAAAAPTQQSNMGGKTLLGS